MDLSQLAILLKVVSERGFARAAHKLTRSQPAVSMAMQRLESELGQKLFDRNLKDGALTDAGKIVYEYADKIEVLHQKMLGVLNELQEKHIGRLTIGTNENGALYIADCIRVFRQHYPHVKVEIRRPV